MDKDQCFYLGLVTKTHGSKGDVVAFFDVDDPSRYRALQSVFLDFNGELTPFFVERIQNQSGQHFRIKFEDINDMDATTLLLKKDLYLPLDLLPPKSGKHFYYHEVIGFEVVDEHKGSIGTVDQIIENPVNPLLQISDGSHEIMIPINDEVISEVDRLSGVIRISAPEGLIDLYL